ncbi:hemicentin-2-like [Anableps anableps]
MQPGHTNTYYFRLDCNNLKYTFKEASVKIDVKDNFPSPTLTPSSVKVRDGDSVSLTCSAPVSCLSHPPNLTWTPTVGESHETLQENQDKTLVKTSVLNFTASYLHDGEKIHCNAVYKKQDGNSDTSLTSATSILCTNCGNFEVSLPQTVQVLSGSCVTVPCSFGLQRKYDKDLNGGCRALWVYSDNSDARLTDTNPVTGNLTEKDCTTTFSNMQPGHTNTYYFRLDCNNLKYTFKEASVKIDVKDNFPSPTLTPSTLKVRDGDSVSLTCSTPVPCLSHPPNLTWTPTVGESHETLQENQDKTLVKTSVLNFTASRQNHGQISCNAVHSKQDRRHDVAFSAKSNILCPECDKFEVSLPQTVQVLSGSCVTIPCSFEIQRKYEKNLHEGCKALWVYFESGDPRLTDTNPVTGNLTEKDCTTTFSNMQLAHTNTYYFRLDCTDLKYTFATASVKIDVKEHFPSPTLTPSTLEGKEGDWVNLMCSAPAPCLTHPPTLTWTPKLGEILETLDMSPNKTAVKTSIMSFTATNLHHRLNISCNAVYKKGNGSTDASLTTSLKAEILFPPRILSSSSCIKTTSQINCSCEIVGKPPILQWLFNGQPANQSEVSVSSESLNGTYLRSTIAVNQPQERNLSSLLCFSFNSLGSDSKQLFINSPEVSAENQVPPRILPSSSCIKTTSQINCSCEIVGKPPILQWFFNGQPVNQSGKHFVITNFLYGTYLRSNITVSQPQDKNVSSLLCFSFNSLGSDSKQLFVNTPEVSAENQVPPRILSSSSCIKTTSQINCSCEIVGKPPILQWLFNGQPANQSEGFVISESLNGTYLRSTIAVNQPQERNLSSLLCFSFNSLGSDSKQLFINSPKVSDENQVPPRILSSSSCIKTTSQINCSCEIVGKPPILQWLFNGQPVNQSEGFVISESLNGTYLRSTITVNQLQERNLSSLLCFSFNSLGSDSKQLFINSPDVSAENQVPPRILSSSSCIKTTSQINCSCEIVGKPPILQWLFNGQPVNQSEGFVISESLNGTYLRSTIAVNQPQERNLSSLLCFSFNSLGSDSKQLFINSPKVSDENQAPPRILSSSSCIKTTSQINCSCEIVGKPPILQWLFNGQPVNQSEVSVISESLNGTYLRSTITVNQPQERNLSSLLCFSFNSLGSDSKQLFINSPKVSDENQVPPRILSSSSCIRTTSQINCSCEIVGKSPILQWHFNGQPANHSEVSVISESLNGTYLRSTITVNQPQERNLSSLLCFSFNSLGSDSKQLFINSPKVSDENQVAPRILPSSSCIKTTSQINCSCEIVGKPPILQWLFNGQPVNQSEGFVISESLNGTYLRSTIAVNQLQERNLSSLLCFSFNSLGSDSKQLFINSPEVSAENQDKEHTSMFIGTTVILLVLVCVLLFVIGFQKTHRYSEHKTFARKATKVQNTTEDDIDIHTVELRETKIAHSATGRPK